MEKLVIATRGSRLALWQANHVKDSLEAVHPGLAVELNIIKTKGDIILDVPLAKVGGKGLFVKELDRALAAGEVDLTVHSLKDVPMEQPDGLPLIAFPKRADARDALVLPENGNWDREKPIGCSSARRRVQLSRLFPGIEVKPVRGNVQTRLRRLDSGEYGALERIVLEMKGRGFVSGRVHIAHCGNPDAADRLKKMLHAVFPGAQVDVSPCGGLCSYYAELGGLMVGYEDNEAPAL